MFDTKGLLAAVKSFWHGAGACARNARSHLSRIAEPPQCRRNVTVQAEAARHWTAELGTAETSVTR